jgi:hypothetical protein
MIFFEENLNVSQFYKDFYDFEIPDNFPDRVIEFLSSHFSEFNSSFLTGFPISILILIRILSNPSLELKNEDSLYKMIRYQMESNLGFAELFSFVRFEFLSVESIEDFISWSCENFESFEHFF